MGIIMKVNNVDIAIVISDNKCEEFTLSDSDLIPSMIIKRRCTTDMSNILDSISKESIFEILFDGVSIKKGKISKILSNIKYNIESACMVEELNIEYEVVT